MPEPLLIATTAAKLITDIALLPDRIKAAVKSSAVATASGAGSRIIRGLRGSILGRRK